MRENGQTTMITSAGTVDSPDRYGCPGVHHVHGYDEERFVIGRTGVSADARGRLADHIKPGEQVVSVPRWVPCGLMDMDALVAFMDDHLHRSGDSVFRMERLPQYLVGDPLYDIWQAGGQLDMDYKAGWLAELETHRAEGIRHTRVRVLPADLTDYQVYACQWGYALNEEAGEEIRVLREGEHDIPAGLIRAEYWLVNDEVALPTLYTEDGEFIGAGWVGPEESARYLTDRDTAWEAAEPFGQWWARHPELHRGDRTERMVA